MDVPEASLALATMVVEAMASQLTTTFCALTQVTARKANASETTSRVIFNLSLLERQEARQGSVRGQKAGAPGLVRATIGEHESDPKRQTRPALKYPPLPP